MRTTRPRKDSRRALKAELDRLTSLIVRLRDQACITCNSRLNLECSHFFSRSNMGVRFDLLNTHAQCQICNQRHNTDRTAYENFMVRTYGVEAIQELETRRIEKEKMSDGELKDLILEYKGLLEALKSEVA